MPRLNDRLPKYRLHKPSGKAVVTVGGKDFYLASFEDLLSRIAPRSVVLIAERSATIGHLFFERCLGTYGTKASREAYDRVVGEWVAKGRPKAVKATKQLTVSELISVYWEHVKRYYVKHGNGRFSSEARLVAGTLTEARKSGWSEIRREVGGARTLLEVDVLP